MVMSEGMKNRKMMAVMTVWWCSREETQERVIE